MVERAQLFAKGGAPADNVGVTSISPASEGVAYLLGNTSVVITAADAAGNVASCTARVTVTGKSTKSDMEKKWNILRAAPMKRLHHLHQHLPTLTVEHCLRKVPCVGK